MPRKNIRPAEKKRRAKTKLRMATSEGKMMPSYFRSQNPHLSDMGLAMAFMAAGILARKDQSK